MFYPPPFTSEKLAYGNNLSCTWTFDLTPGERFRVQILIYSVGKNDVLCFSDDKSSFVNNYTYLFPPYTESYGDSRISCYFYSESDLHITFTAN